VRRLLVAAQVSYERLCELFWDRLGESRYKLNQVGNDRGTQYRHGIYPLDAEQTKTALATLDEAKAAAPLGMRVHTEVLPAEEFWDAEGYHQQYLQKGGQNAKKQARETIRCYG
jgi:peptide-methionine (S)-S-oxide reductase